MSIPEPALLDDSAVFGWTVDLEVGDRMAFLAEKRADLEGKCALLAVGMKGAHEARLRAEAEGRRLAWLTMDAVAAARRREKVMGWAALAAVVLMAILVLTVR